MHAAMSDAMDKTETDNETDLKLQKKNERIKSVQTLVASIQAEQGKRSAFIGSRNRMTTSLRKGRGQRKEYKVQVGWQHYRNGKYRVVTKANGGGTRIIQYGYGEDLTVDSLKSQAIGYFFPDGKNEKGSIDHFEIALVSTAGQEIETFLDSNKEPCNFALYLKSNGIYASQCHFSLRTKRKEKKMYKLNGVVVNKSVNIRYSKTKQSLYSEQLSEISCYSYKDCFCVSGYPDSEEYDPFQDGFLVSRIVQEKTVFLENNEKEYICPEATEKEQFVLNGPSEIYGFQMDNGSRLILGVITLAHNQNHLYNWWRNGNLFCSGLNRCVIEVTDPGEYNVTVTSNLDSGILGKSDIAKVDTIRCHCHRHYLHRQQNCYHRHRQSIRRQRLR